MSHFVALVLVDDPEEVSERLAPYQETDEWFEDGTKWDWWVEGGRWTGFLSDYDPYEDPDNKEPCDLCGGTGDRATWRDEPKERQHLSGCNGCNGTGMKLKWNSEWKQQGNRAPVKDVLKMLKDDKEVIPFAIVTPDEWIERGQRGWWAVVKDEKDKDEWKESVVKVLKAHEDKLAVAVDCHI
jgi:hypothetical protein